MLCPPSSKTDLQFSVGRIARFLKAGKYIWQVPFKSQGSVDIDLSPQRKSNAQVKIGLITGKDMREENMRKMKEERYKFKMMKCGQGAEIVYRNKLKGTDKPIYNGRRYVGIKKALLFYKGRPQKSTKADWIMHEYRLNDPPRAHHQIRFNGCTYNHNTY